jgi:hypothetical protein
VPGVNRKTAVAIDDCAAFILAARKGRSVITTTNITNTDVDLGRYLGGEDMRHFCRRHGLSGLELLPYGGLGGGTIPPELIRGVHLTYHNCWVDYWNGNAAGVEAE